MNRVIFATIALIMAGAMTAAADFRDDALAAMKRCAALSDQQARLVCYDKVPQTHDQAAPPAAAIAEPAQPPRQERQGLLEESLAMPRVCRKKQWRSSAARAWN